MKIVSLKLSSPEVKKLFSEYDDFIISFLDKDSGLYTRYNERENIQSVWIVFCDEYL